MRLKFLFYCSVCACLTAPFQLHAQTGAVAGALSQTARIQKTTLPPPVLDGILDDEIWQQATRITDVHQVQPVDHGEPTEEGIYYVTYDDDYFYMAARLYDSEPDLIRASQLIQGQGVFSDDTVDILLDTFNNDRTAFYFSTNPNGIRSEGVWESASSFNSDWNGIWQVEARIDDEGWTAEFAIPFTTLNFDPNTDEWGMNLGRTISRKNERVYWSSFNRSTNPSTAGQVQGISEIRQGLGLDIVPSITAARVEDYVAGTNEDRIDPSLDVFYKFTPNLTGVLTLNTDFSATEVDDRQVNLTRFSLFFPEKRDFFLQDSEIFSFGGIGGGNRNGIPFYSRRIGLDPASGQPVDIDVGGKLAGRVGGISVGALAVRQGDRPGLAGQDVFVGRITANILAESRIGAMVTSGDPNSEIGNTLVGVDFSYRNTRFLPSHTLTSDIWYQQTDTDGIEGDDKAYNSAFELSTEGTGFSVEGEYRYVGAQYNPSLGFANRGGVDQLSATVDHRYILNGHPLIRNLFSSIDASHTRDIDTKAMQSESIDFTILAINSHAGDRLSFSAEREREGLQGPFEISPGIIIPAGKYTFSSGEVSFGAASRRDISPGLSYKQGDFYSGEQREVSASMDWQVNRNLSLDFSYTFTDVELPQGEFVSRLISLDAGYAFNSRWSWVNLLQYDNGSGSLGVNSRVNWSPRAGEDLYLVLNYNFDSTFGAFKELNSTDSELVVKYTRNFRF